MRPANTIVFCLLFTALSLAFAETPSRVKTYPLKWVNGAELLEAVTSIIGEEGKAFKYSAGNELIISTTDVLHEQISQLIKSIDRPVPNVEIQVIMNEAGQSRDSAFDLGASGNVKVNKRGTSTNFKFSPQFREQSTLTTTMNTQLLLVQSGREGQLHIGEVIPYADWLFYYGKSHGYIDWNFSFEPKRIGAILVASPQVIGSGPAISITLTPEIRVMAGDEFKRFKYTKLATTVTAIDGQPLNIGGSAQNREFYDKFLSGYNRNGSIKSLNITLVPRIKHVKQQIDVNQFKE